MNECKALPGGGRNNVTNRYLRHFSLICATPFDENTLTKIFSTLVDWWMKSKSIPAGAAKLRNPLVSATIDLYQTAGAYTRPLFSLT